MGALSSTPREVETDQSLIQMREKTTYGVPGMTGDNEGRGVGVTDGVLDGTEKNVVRSDNTRKHDLEQKLTLRGCVSQKLRWTVSGTCRRLGGVRRRRG